jgi:hypothetical protein
MVVQVAVAKAMRQVVRQVAHSVLEQQTQAVVAVVQLLKHLAQAALA